MGVSEGLNEPEIIFPEITAIAIGALYAPRQSWNVTKGRILLSIAVMSVTGVLIVRFLPDIFVLRIVCGFIAAIIMLTATKSGFVPMISACVLPIVLGTTSLIYPCAAIVMTVLILICRMIFEHFGICKKREFIPEIFDMKKLKYWLKHLCVITLFAIAAMVTGERFFMVPPLIVAYVEMSTEGSPLRKQPVNTVILIGFAAVLGTFSRIFIAERFGLGLVTAAVVSVGIIMIVMKLMKMYMPPAGAICTLPVLLQADTLTKYPLECIVGFVIMTVIGMVLFRYDDNR